MKHFRIVFCLLICLVLFSSCGKQPVAPREPITLFPPREDVAPQTDGVNADRQQTAAGEMQSVFSAEAQAQTRLRQSVNPSYGEKQQVDEIGLTIDNSDVYRTEDSFAFEQDALREAKAMVAQSLASPESLSVSDTRVTDCADDGECVYYRVYMEATYRVQSGEQITRGIFKSVGIRKQDRKPFDASDKIRSVLNAYSIYATDVRKTRVDCDTDAPDYEAAARQIALAQLKDPASGVFQSSTRRVDDAMQAPNWIVFDVVCTGVNDYGMTIPGVYTIFMVLEDGAMRQIDPNAQ